jgi:hypothetical protein
MFKDRIKEIGRTAFSKYLHSILYDRRTIIRTQNGKHRLGILREKVDFIKEQDIPRGIIKARNRDLITELDNDGQGEWVIRYSKEITLFTSAFFKTGYADTFDITGINDITRFDIRPYLRKMADPVQERPYLAESGLVTLPSHKVYHLNVISRYRSRLPHKEKLYRRVRLILNRDGIKRVEHISV